jgi:16S rRNA G527 N7-methylase RsmG
MILSKSVFTKVTTNFLNPINDRIEVYIKKTSDLNVIVHDDGETLNLLDSLVKDFNFLENHHDILKNKFEVFIKRGRVVSIGSEEDSESIIYRVVDSIRFLYEYYYYSVSKESVN